MEYHKESDGERAIRAALENMNLSYEQEKTIYNLKGDTKQFRTADFYLPNEKVYIEYFGGWDKFDSDERDSERKRYRHKRFVYEKNGIKCIYIYPKQLYYVTNVIKKELANLTMKPKKRRKLKTIQKEIKKEITIPVIGWIIAVIFLFMIPTIGILFLVLMVIATWLTNMLNET